MINAIIYLNHEHNPKELITHLLSQKLIASASVDQNNICYEMEDSEIKERKCTVITVQSKSLLFNALVDAVEKKLGEQVPICSTPIVNSNPVFDTAIRTKTIPT